MKCTKDMCVSGSATTDHNSSSTGPGLDRVVIKKHLTHTPQVMCTPSIYLDRHTIWMDHTGSFQTQQQGEEEKEEEETEKAEVEQNCRLGGFR